MADFAPISEVSPFQIYNGTKRLSTAATNENLIACRADSGNRILATSFRILNEDSIARTFILRKHNLSGAPIHNEEGVNDKAEGTDSVAGTSYGGWLNQSIAANGEFVCYHKDSPLLLWPNESIIVQAEAVDVLTFDIVYRVY
jgi:hypothetical protein